jgi:hypothetical protein
VNCRQKAVAMRFITPTELPLRTLFRPRKTAREWKDVQILGIPHLLLSKPWALCLYRIIEKDVYGVGFCVSKKCETRTTGWSRIWRAETKEDRLQRKCVLWRASIITIGAVVMLRSNF